MELRENNGADSALRYPETDEAHLVAFGVAGIGAIEIRSVKGAWAGIAFVGAAMRQGCGMSRIHRRRSEEHTSELQSLMRTSYAVFCLTTKNKETNVEKT